MHIDHALFVFDFAVVNTPSQERCPTLDVLECVPPILFCSSFPLAGYLSALSQPVAHSLL